MLVKSHSQKCRHNPSVMMTTLSDSFAGAWPPASRVMRLLTSPSSDVNSDELMAEKFQAVECIGPDLDGYDIDEAIAGYRLQLSCLSLDAHLSLRKFIAQPVLLILQSDAKPRHFHGHVTQCRLQGANGGMARYLLTIEPWLAFLRYRRDSRVYQDLTVPEIIDAVLRDYQGQGKLQPQWRMDLRDTRVYARRSLVTQYQESDLAFISRLLSEEGMFYYVEHAGVSNSPSLGAHTVVIADHNASFQSNARADVQFTQASAVMAQDSIDRWRSLDRWQTNSVEILTWDYRQASVSGFATACAGMTGGWPASRSGSSGSGSHWASAITSLSPARPNHNGLLGSMLKAALFKRPDMVAFTHAVAKTGDKYASE